MAKIVSHGDSDDNNQIESHGGTHQSANPIGSLPLWAIRSSPKDLIIRPMVYLGQGSKQCRAINEGKGKFKSAPKWIGGSNRADLRDRWYSGRQDDPDTEDDERYATVSPDKIAQDGGRDALLYLRPPNGVVVNGAVQACFTR
jgi:hypothetical protein